MTVFGGIKDEKTALEVGRSGTLGYKSPIRFLDGWMAYCSTEGETSSMNPTSWNTKNRGNLKDEVVRFEEPYGRSQA